MERLNFDLLYFFEDKDDLIQPEELLAATENVGTEKNPVQSNADNIMDSEKPQRRAKARGDASRKPHHALQKSDLFTAVKRSSDLLPGGKRSTVLSRTVHYDISSCLFAMDLSRRCVRKSDLLWPISPKPMKIGRNN